VRVENDTNDPVDYDQTGTGGDDEEGRCKGMLTPRGTPNSHRTFPPCGKPPWTVSFTNVPNGHVCESPELDKANATVRIVRFGGCQISVEEP